MHPAHPSLPAILFVSFAGLLPAQEPSPRSTTLDRAARDLPAAGTASAPTLGTQTGPIRLIDVSLDIMAAAGASSERDAVLGDLQGGGHDPKKRGFTLQQAELSLAGAVDPYLQGKAHMVALLDPDEGETLFELEEAYLTTQQLPYDLQVKAGTYLTEFGRINPTHPHQWDWQDQPVIHTRLFGGDGMRGPGARVSWLVPGSTYGELFFGVQNANGETMPSFLANDEVYEERAIGGRQFTEREVRSGNDLVYSARAVTSLDPSADSTLGFGASALLGPNATGGDADTVIWGVDFAWRWRPASHRRGYPFWKLQGEFLARAFDAAEQTDDSDPLNPVTIPGETLRDHGGYLQLSHGFAEGWAAGVRVDWVSGSGDNYDADTQSLVGRDGDPFRTDRVRVAPMLSFAPSEFSRIRLQYNYDDSDALDDPVHSVWLGFEVLIGTHPPHTY
ncbi:MAG: hypothetical protein JNL08_14655 [Planctomycetes bacterium]|nr:hypothetical protein [Planctomycetota bacterium]